MTKVRCAYCQAHNAPSKMTLQEEHLHHPGSNRDAMAKFDMSYVHISIYASMIPFGMCCLTHVLEGKDSIRHSYKMVPTLRRSCFCKAMARSISTQYFLPDDHSWCACTYAGHRARLEGTPAQALQKEDVGGRTPPNNQPACVGSHVQNFTVSSFPYGRAC